MPPLLVRLNLPGFSSPEPFRLASAPPSMTGLACAVLEEIGGFSKEELNGVRNNLERVPLTLLGELCAGQLVELASDAELEVFLATAESPRGPAIIEVRPRDVSAPGSSEAASEPPGRGAPALRAEAAAHGGHAEAQLVVTPGRGEAPASRAAGPPSAPRGIAPEPGRSTQASANGSTAERRRATPDSKGRSKLRGPSARAPTPPQERRQPSAPTSDVGTPTTMESPHLLEPNMTYAQVSHHQPVHIRLYQEKDERRRRLEEARMLRLEQEDADIRASAQRALCRAPSPGRMQSPARDYDQAAVQIRSSTPPRIRPPLPAAGVRSSLDGGLGRNTRPSSAGSRPSSAGRGGGRPGAAAAESGGGPSYRDQRGSGGSSSARALAATSSGQAARTSPGQRGVAADYYAADASSAASESGAHGLQSAASVGTLHGEDSIDVDAVNSSTLVMPDDVAALQALVLKQQQRIEFTEGMHQQALRSLRKSRQELSVAQQQRFREADKVLGLEQIISEMQVLRFDGDAQMQLRWEDWLQRSGAILEAE